jgi:hypothetical protein
MTTNEAAERLRDRAFWIAPDDLGPYLKDLDEALIAAKREGIAEGRRTLGVSEGIIRMEQATYNKALARAFSDGAREVIRKYHARHLPYCKATTTGDDPECTCGLSAFFDEETAR